MKIKFCEFDILNFSTSGVEFELILAGGHQADVKRITKDLTKYLTKDSNKDLMQD